MYHILKKKGKKKEGILSHFERQKSVAGEYHITKCRITLKFGMWEELVDVIMRILKYP